MTNVLAYLSRLYGRWITIFLSYNSSKQKKFYEQKTLKNRHENTEFISPQFKIRIRQTVVATAPRRAVYKIFLSRLHG